MCHWIKWHTEDIQTILNKLNLVLYKISIRRIVQEQFQDGIEIELVDLIRMNRKHVYQ